MNYLIAPHPKHICLTINVLDKTEE